MYGEPKLIFLENSIMFNFLIYSIDHFINNLSCKNETKQNKISLNKYPNKLKRS